MSDSTVDQSVSVNHVVWTASSKVLLWGRTVPLDAFGVIDLGTEFNMTVTLQSKILVVWQSKDF